MLTLGNLVGFDIVLSSSFSVRMIEGIHNEFDRLRGGDSDTCCADVSSGGQERPACRR